MCSIFSAVSNRWTNWQRNRTTRALDSMQAETRTLELIEVEAIAVAQQQMAICKKAMDDQLAQCVGSEPSIVVLHSFHEMECTYKRLEADLAAANMKLSTYYGTSRMIADQREASDAGASVTLNKIAAKLKRMKRDPLKEARESEKRDMQTARIFAQQREAAAAQVVGEGPKAIHKALTEDHTSLHLQAQEEEAAIEAEAMGQMSPLESIRAKFAAANEMAMHAMPVAVRPVHTAVATMMVPVPLRATTTESIKSPTKSKNGKKYTQVVEDADEGGGGGEEGGIEISMHTL